MLQTTIGKLYLADTSPYRLYVIKNGEGDVLYVGQSVNVKSRISGHRKRGTLLGAALLSNYPQSQEWELDLYTVDECMDRIKYYFPYAPRESLFSYVESKMESFAEDALIHDLLPRYNITINFGSSWENRPFHKRKIHPETQAYLDARQEAKEKAEREAKQQFKERQEFLVNSTCTICGEHETDRWAYNDTPCGLCDAVSIHDGEKYVTISLVCHKCRDIINHLDAIRKNAEIVRKIEDKLEELARLKRAENQHGEQLAALFGIE